MSEQERMRTHELLTKADVMREYRYPLALLNHDIETGKIAYFRRSWSRLYIPRYAIEQRITDLASRHADLDTEERKGA